MAEKPMTTGRLEAFSDGVIAIIVTIMVLELKVPLDTHPAALFALWPIFLSYALSYLMVAEYWVNHHHLLHFARRADTPVLWSNIVFLFVLSFIPFTTAYLGQSHASSFAAAVLFRRAPALRDRVSHPGRRRMPLVAGRFPEARAIYQAARRKNWIAIGFYVAAIAATFRSAALGLSLDLLVAMMYFVPTVWIENSRGAAMLRQDKPPVNS